MWKPRSFLSRVAPQPHGKAGRPAPAVLSFLDIAASHRQLRTCATGHMWSVGTGSGSARARRGFSPSCRAQGTLVSATADAAADSEARPAKRRGAANRRQSSLRRDQMSRLWPPSAPSGSGGRRDETFLASRGMRRIRGPTQAVAWDGRRRGEESRWTAVAAEAIEAEPASGQIRPSGNAGSVPSRT